MTYKQKYEELVIKHGKEAPLVAAVADVLDSTAKGVFVPTQLFISKQSWENIQKWGEDETQNPK